MKRVLLTDKSGRVRVGQGLVQIKNFDRENSPPMFATLSIYDPHLEATRLEKASLGDKVSVSGSFYRVSNLQNINRPQRLLVELETLDNS